MIRNRWPTAAEVDAHPAGREGWWVLTWLDGEAKGESGQPSIQPLNGYAVEADRGEEPENPPDVAFPIHRGAPLATSLPEAAGRLAATLPADEAHSARVRDMMQEAGRLRGGDRYRIVPAEGGGE